MALYIEANDIDNDDLTDEEADQLALLVSNFIREDTDAVNPGSVEIKSDEWRC
mgnify:CR=1 FL=1